jgi:hypothetical protein
MPIDREEFDAGETHDALETRIEQFLREHPMTAYSAEEIAVAIDHPAAETIPGLTSVQSVYRLLQRLGFIAVLDGLVLQGKIERRSVRTAHRSETFYAARTHPAPVASPSDE